MKEAHKRTRGGRTTVGGPNAASLPPLPHHFNTLKIELRSRKTSISIPLISFVVLPLSQELARL